MVNRLLPLNFEVPAPKTIFSSSAEIEAYLILPNNVGNRKMRFLDNSISKWNTMAEV